MNKEESKKKLTEYEEYCRMMAMQQEEDMDETIANDIMTEYMPEGVFVRGH